MLGSRTKSTVGSFFSRSPTITKHRHGILTSIAWSIQNFYHKKKCVIFGTRSREILSSSTYAESVTKRKPPVKLQNTQPNPSAEQCGDTPNSFTKQSSPSRGDEPSNLLENGQNCLCHGCRMMRRNGKKSERSHGSSNAPNAVKPTQQTS